jgi:hypothetical protein
MFDPLFPPVERKRVVHRVIPAGSVRYWSSTEQDGIDARFARFMDGDVSVKSEARRRAEALFDLPERPQPEA